MHRNFNVKMSTTVSTEDLLKKIKENRDQHQKDFDVALKGYLAKMEVLLTESLNSVRKGNVLSLNRVHLPVPENYTSAYDTVIQMLEWSRETNTTLSADEFRQFVQDEWDWKDGFKAVALSYSSGG